MQAAPSAADTAGEERPPAREVPEPAPPRLPVRTVLAYGTGMPPTLREPRDRSQSGFDADLLEALTACAELVNTGRSASGDGLRGLADVRAFGRRYAFDGRPAEPADLLALRSYRARLDEVITACEAGHQGSAIRLLNGLLAETGAVPQIVAHSGRGPHVHVSRRDAPLADRIAAHLAMGLAELLVAGESHRLRSCASPGCSEVFLDLSRNRSRRYCNSRTCGNRLHVAAYRARKAAGALSLPASG
jgi:predicted RNA-binding Zn ribbon-like protein